MTIVEVKPAREEDIIIDKTHNNEMEGNANEDENKIHVSPNITPKELETKKDNNLDKEFNSTMRGLWTDFRENTTMHGVKNFKMGYKCRHGWMIWMLAWLGMGSLLVYNMYKLYANYSANPTFNKIDVKYVQEMVFPAITICNLSPYKKSAMSPAMESFMLHGSKIASVLPPLDFSDPVLAELHETPTTDWFNRSSFSMDDMFLFCSIGWYLKDCRQIMTRTITEWGLCFTYNSLNKTKEKGRVKESKTGSSRALAFYIDVKTDDNIYSRNLAAGVKVVLHEPEEEPDMSNQGFVVSPGLSTYVSMKMTKYKYLPAPYKAGGDRYCVDTKAPGYVNPLKYYPEYSRSACLLECRRDYIVGECGCRAITDRGNERYCTFVEFTRCYKTYSVDFDTLSEPKSQCNCQILCEYSIYDYSISTAPFADIYFSPLAQVGFTDIKNDKLEVLFYYDTLSFLSVESFPEYNAEDIIGKITKRSRLKYFPNGLRINGCLIVSHRGLVRHTQGSTPYPVN